MTPLQPLRLPIAGVLAVACWLAPLVPHAGLLLAQGAQTVTSGTVFDTYTRTPLADVSVSLAEGGPAVMSGADGRFQIPCPGARPLVFRRLGYESYRLTVANCAENLQVGLTGGTQNLNAVSVVATRDAPGIEQPQSITTLAHSELTRGTGLFLDDALNLVPGVRMERRTMAGGQRITIRGYGNRTNFDGSGYKAYLNGIPITDAEGVTVLDDIDFGTVGKVDVIRGPASSLYGAGIGGIVNLYTLRPDREGTTLEQGMMGGADGLRRYDTRLASASSGSSLLLNYGKQDYDSYRVHSASRKDYATFVGDFRPSDRRTISTYFAYAHSYDERAGQLDSAQFFGKENVGEVPYLQNDGHVDMESVRVGLTHGYRVNEHLLPEVTAYYSGITREDVFAVGVTPKAAQTFGARAVINTSFASPTVRLSGVSGLDFEKTNLFSKNYRLANLVQGPITTDLETHTMQYSIFSQWDLALPHEVTLTAGASANFIEYALVDRLTNTGNPTHLDLTGRKTFDPVVTPRIALRKGFGSDLSLYVSVSQGYTPPTSSDAVIGFTGEANDGLTPERATQYEVGAKGNLFARRLAWQVALFDLEVSDKLTSQGVFDNAGTQLYAYTVNAGDQANKGFEATAAWSVVDRPASPLTLLRPFVSLTLSDFTYSNFKSDHNANARTIDYTGKDVVGVPGTVVGYGVDAGVHGGGYLNATLEHRGTMPITYDNVHAAPAYSVLNAKVGIARSLGPHLGIDAYVGGTNLTGALYYNMVFLNASFAAAPPAIYLPGPYSSRYFGGVKVSVRR
ncbi:MAG: TonB-dependent receptor plug domain-containing protein [Gemmatimonadota bacterium]